MLSLSNVSGSEKSRLCVDHSRYVLEVEMCMGMGFPMGMGIKHRIGNGKPPHWEWELPALPWEFIPKGFMLR